MESKTTQRRARRHDPERRDRIARAAVAVVARDGLDGLTHRAVAKEADVPLGSTTYHFADKDELLKSAVEIAQAEDRDMIAATLESFGPDDDLAGAIARLIEHLTVHDRERLLFGYELFLAARHRPNLTNVARHWTEDTEALFARFIDDRSARVLIEMLEGILSRSVVFREPIHAEVVEPDLRHAIDSFRAAASPDRIDGQARADSGAIPAR